MKRWAMALLALMMSFGSLGAQSAPHGTCGSLPANSFGGQGISTAEVMLGGVQGAVFGLSATQSYTSPGFSSDGQCTFFTETGSRTGGPVNTGFMKANFDYYAGPISPGNLFLMIDLNPGVNSPFSSMSVFALPWGAFDSSNPGYFGPSLFDPNVPGEYTFAIQQRDAFGGVMDYVAINIEVHGDTPTVTPEPASLALLATGLVGIASFGSRRKIKY